MFWRSLVVALVCVSVYALTPLSAAGDDNDCALYLAGPGRTSAYDYRLNLLRGNFGYDGQHTCITYDAVNQAYLEARKRILVAQPKGDWTPEDYASVGELVLDISINLARTYGLTYEEIEKGLPLIDTSRTLIREVCPPVFSHVECRAGKYRRLDGLCNNLRQPTWGATMAPFQRLIGPLFSDGINAPRIAHSGHELPLSRVVSRTMHPDDGFHDHAGTVMVIAWGQFMDHDYTLTGTPLDPRNRNDPEECCKRPQHLKHPYCNEIRIPDDDYFYRLFGVKCIDFVRGFPSPRPGCRLGSRVPFNTLTGAIDGNTVYGVTEKFARKLRTGYGGLLRMNPVFEEYGLKDLLPLKLDIPDEGCTRPNKNMYCFEAGEIRVNEQLVLTVMHTLMAREHNRAAKGLAAVNPHWDDETLYQEARRINIAEIQHITYNEFLPVLLGKDVMEKFGLVTEKQGYWDGYDQNVNPDVIDAFAAAAYRFGHSLLPTAVERWSKAHKFIASKRLSDLIRRPYDLYRAGVLDEYVMGLMNQVAQAMDDSITQEVTNHLFKKVGARFGMDLVSFNMQRGREFGLPGYMEFRKFCGLSGADTFQELFGSMPNETVRKYESIFEHPIDVDLWSGGVSERPLPGSMLGPTFACIIATQFSYSRRGDRFWYELPNQPSSFTPEQLKEVRKARLARVICDNTDIIDTTQLYPFVLPDHELNPRVPCKSGIIPSIDFSKWAEPPPFVGNAKQFITDAIVQENNVTDFCQEHGISDNGTVRNSEKHIHESNDVPADAIKLVEPVVNLTQICDNTNTSEGTLNIIAKTDSKEKQIVLSPDTVQKYINKEKDQFDNVEKNKSHVKNSLRRKRSTEEVSESKKAPLIVNYETTHTPGVVLTPYLQYPLKKTYENFIQPSALTEFSLQTLKERPIVVLNSAEVQNDDDVKELYKKQGRPKFVLRKNSGSLEKDSSESSSVVRESSENIDKSSDENSTELDKSSDENSKEHRHVDERSSYRKKPNGYKYVRYTKRPNKDSESNEGGEKENYTSDERSSDESSEKQKKGNDYDGTYSKLENERTVKSRPKDDSSSSEENESSVSDEAVELRNPHDNDSRSEEKQSYTEKDTDLLRRPQYSSEESDETLNDKEKDKNHLRNLPHASEESDDKRNYRDKENEDLRKSPYISEKSYDKPRYRNKDVKPQYDSRESDEKYEQKGEDKFIKPGEYSSERIDKQDYRNEDELSRNREHDSETDENPEYSHKGDYRKDQDESEENEELSDNRNKNTPKKNRNVTSETKDKTEYRGNKELRNDRQYGGERSTYRNQDRPNDSIETLKEKHQEFRHPENLLTAFSRDITESEKNQRKPAAFSNEKPHNRQSDSDVEVLQKPRPFSNLLYSIKDEIDRKKPIKIQDVDLRDFSYERVKLNEKGIVEPIKDDHDNNDKENSERDLSPAFLISDSKESSDYTRKTNEGEIKPVVEISNESSESSEEKEHDRPPTLDPIDEDKIVKSIDTSKIDDSKEISGKLENPVVALQGNPGNVKQEFERIPVNYNHDKKSKQEKPQEPAQVSETPPARDEDSPKYEDDEYTPPLRDIKYDDKLNVKFLETPIELPEIKLPEDILAYDYKEPEKTNNNFYHHDSEEEKGDNAKREDDDDDEEHTHYGPYKSYYRDRTKENNRKKQDDNDEESEDENVDLYEKFVRERFGKKDSFEKRSEKLQQRSYIPNPKLYETIEKILKKTKETDKEAARSGDPNAAYMWTLEYGEKL